MAYVPLSIRNCPAALTAWQGGATYDQCAAITRATPELQTLALQAWAEHAARERLLGMMAAHRGSDPA